MNEDLVYGILSDEDILTDANGHETEGISTFRIESFKGKVKKEYRQDGLYITNVTVGSTMMEFELSAKSGNAYTVQKKDNIMNNKSIRKPDRCSIDHYKPCRNADPPDHDSETGDRQSAACLFQDREY